MKVPAVDREYELSENAYRLVIAGDVGDAEHLGLPVGMELGGDPPPRIRLVLRRQREPPATGTRIVQDPDVIAVAYDVDPETE